MFTVPAGGDGWYYFSAYFRVNFDEYALFNIQLNGSYRCTMIEDDTGDENGDDGGQGGCGTVIYVEAGKNRRNIIFITGLCSALPLYVAVFSEKSVKCCEKYYR